WCPVRMPLAMVVLIVVSFSLPDGIAFLFGTTPYAFAVRRASAQGGLQVAILTGTWEFKRSKGAHTRDGVSELTELWLLTVTAHADGKRLEGLLTRSDTIKASYRGISSEGARRCFGRQSDATAEYVVTVNSRIGEQTCEWGCLQASLLGCKGDCQEPY